MAVGIGIAWRAVDPATVTLIAITLIANAILVPAVRTPEGGTLTFPTAILLATAFLYDLATAFVGVSLGWTVGHTVFHRREFWRGTSNALGLAFGVSAGAMVVSLLRTHLPLAAVTAVGPAILVGVNRITNVAWFALFAHVRWAMAPWPYFLAHIRGSTPDQFIDMVWLVPVTVGSVLLTHQWWWLLLVGSLPLSALDALIMTRSHGWKKAGDAVITDTLARMDDPRLRAITAHLARGAALADPGGRMFIATPAALALCGVHEALPDTRLHDLFVETDAPTINRLFAVASRSSEPQTAELRPRALADRTVIVTIANRLADPRLRGFAVTMQEATDEHRQWRALMQYADRTFAAPLVRALEQERKRVGQEVDLSIRQTLALLHLVVNRPVAASGPTAQDLVARAMTAARSIQRSLAPPELHDFGLLATARSYADEFRANGIDVDIQTTFDDSLRFDADVELVAYRIIQWALDNVARHAGVDRATIQLSLSEDTIRIVVADAGRGFRVDRIRSAGGLTQIEGRASLVGGTVTFESEPGKGTRVVVNLPAGTAAAMDRKVGG